MARVFEVGETVRLGLSHGRRFGTPSQRRVLWEVVDADLFTHVTIARTSNPDSMMCVRRDILVPCSSVLELMAHTIDEGSDVS